MCSCFSISFRVVCCSSCSLWLCRMWKVWVMVRVRCGFLVRLVWKLGLWLLGVLLKVVCSLCCS